MSKGSSIINFRVKDDMLDEIKRAIKSHNYHTKGEPLDMSAWLRMAIAAKLRQNKRAKKSQQAKAAKRKQQRTEAA